MKMHGETIKKK